MWQTCVLREVGPVRSVGFLHPRVRRSRVYTKADYALWLGLTP